MKCFLTALTAGDREQPSMIESRTFFHCRWSQGLLFHQAMVDCARAAILMPLGTSILHCRPVNKCSLVETAFLLLVTVSTVNLLTTVLNDSPVLPGWLLDRLIDSHGRGERGGRYLMCPLTTFVKSFHYNILIKHNLRNPVLITPNILSKQFPEKTQSWSFKYWASIGRLRVCYWVLKTKIY